MPHVTGRVCNAVGLLVFLSLVCTSGAFAQQDLAGQTGPYTTLEAAVMIRVWPAIRTAARYEDINWAALGLAGAPGSEEARWLTTRRWGRLRPAANFTDINWQASTAIEDSWLRDSSGPHRLASLGVPAGMLTPTPIPTFERAASSSNSSDSGLNVPDHMWTLENGIRVPHPVTMNGRVLTLGALRHFVGWKGVPAFSKAHDALSDYLLLAILRDNPELMESYLSTYISRFLPMADRGAFPCNPAEPDIEALCGIRQTSEANLSGLGANFANYPSLTDIQQQQIKRAILDSRDRLFEVAPKLPIQFLHISFLGTHDRRNFDSNKDGVRVFYDGPTHIIDRFSGGNRVFFSSTEGVEAPNGLNVPALWQTDLAAAQELFDQLAGGIPVQTEFSLVELTADLNFVRWDAKVRWISAVMYEDQALEHELHRFKCGSLPVCVANR